MRSGAVIILRKDSEVTGKSYHSVGVLLLGRILLHLKCPYRTGLKA